jgi:outer membrane protein
MKPMRFPIILSFLFLFMTSLPFAQAQAAKFGHLNLGNLLDEMPARKAADTELQAYREQLGKKAMEMSEKLKAEVQVLYKQMEEGTISQLQIQEKQKELQAEQQALQKYEQESVANMEKKRRELLGPILEKVQKAIDEVAKENSYTFVFDTSVMNAVLFAEDSDDILPLVKKKLGIE